MYIRLSSSHSYLSNLVKQLRYFSTINSKIIKPYPNYVERQVDLEINTTSGDDTIVIDQESNVKLVKPSTFMKLKVNYIDTNPLGDKNQAIVLLVHGYPGTHESTKSLIEEFQRRNFRCIAPDMPYCGKTKMHLWNSLLWKNAVYARGRFLGELLKQIMRDKMIPIHTVIGFHENSYSLMSMVDQYEYFHCKSLILIDPVPRKLIRFFPLMKLAFDFGRLPFHWTIAKFILKIFGYKELIKYPQKDVVASLRMWLLEDTRQYDAFIHNLWLSRLSTMVVLSEEDKYLDRKLLDSLITDLAVEPFNKSRMANTVIKKYACDHNELLTDRVSYVADDIEKFISMTYTSPAATQAPTTKAAATAKIKATERAERQNSIENENVILDENAYKRASLNDFFANAFGPSSETLKPDQPHSIRSAVEQIAGDFIQKPPTHAKKETLASVKEEMRKKKIRIDTKR